MATTRAEALACSGPLTSGADLFDHAHFSWRMSLVVHLGSPPTGGFLDLVEGFGRASRT